MPSYDGFRNPPNSAELPGYLTNALITLAIATVGTTAAAVLAFIPSVLVARRRCGACCWCCA